MVQKTYAARSIALVAVAAILLVMLSSYFFISEHTNHECTGDDCPVCAVMESCESNVRCVHLAVVGMTVGIVLCTSMRKGESFLGFAVLSLSLVSRKIRLNN